MKCLAGSDIISLTTRRRTAVFKFAGGDVDRIGASGLKEVHDNYFANGGFTICKSGYLYIFVSNESNLSLFFDNLVVTHKPGPILEETHYYPWGLTMAGISGKVMRSGSPDNKNRYNGYEQTTSFDLNLYESFFRSHDPQVGRFLQLDPKPGENLSLYAAMNGNPIMYSDPLGDTVKPGAGFWANLWEGAGATSTRLFRAASTAEVTDMAANGVRNLAGSYETGKLFATT